MPDQSVTATHEQDAAPASSSTKKPSLGRVIAAWGVHLFTISGLVWATLALFAILDNDTPMMWLLARHRPHRGRRRRHLRA